MEYVSLSKLFYSDPDNYKTIYHERFNGRNTIHFDFDIHENKAFLVCEPELYNQIIGLYKINTEIAKLSYSLPGKAIQQFTQKCLIDEIILTNSIEGVYSSRKEINSILTDLKAKSRKKRFEGLVQKYLMLQENEQLFLNTCEDIRELYNELVYTEIEEDDPENLPDGKIFRKDSTSVMSPSQKEIHRGLFPETKIIIYMEKALNILNNQSLQCILRTSVFHYLFGYIHPFYDGNGRTSRYISSYLLSQEFDSLIGYQLAYSIKQNSKKYYDAFKICNDTNNLGDLTPFVYMFVDIIDKALNQLYEKLKLNYLKLKRYISLINILPHGVSAKYGPLYDLLIQASLFSENGISAKELTTYMEISNTTLYKRLNELKPYNLIIKKIDENTHYYSLNLKVVDKIFNETQESKD